VSGGEIRPAGHGVWIGVRIVLGLALVVAVVVAAVAGAVWVAGGDGEAAAAGVRISGESSVEGVAFFEQEGDRMTGYVVVWGLDPNSEHAVHFHGPDSSCGTKADPVAVHPDLRADANGVAFANVEVAAEQELLDGGFYYNVHEGPSRLADNPEIACADLAPTEAAAAG
jgi:hypothetical protein